MKELDYELKVQGLIETASSNKSDIGSVLHWVAAVGQLDVKYLVEKKNCNPMQKNDTGSTALHMAAITGNVDVFKYFISECNCNPACPGPLGLTFLHFASDQGHLDIVQFLSRGT